MEDEANTSQKIDIPLFVVIHLHEILYENYVFDHGVWKLDFIFYVFYELNFLLCEFILLKPL